MDRIRRWIDHYLYSEDLPRDARALNMLCAIGSIVGLAALITRWLEGLPLIVIVVMIVYLSSAIILFCIANYFNVHEVATWITLVTLGNVMFPLSFFLLGGIDAAPAAWFVMSIFVVFFFARGIKLAVFLGLHIAVIIATFTIGALYPDLLYQLNDTQRLAESFLAIFANGLFIGVIARYLISIYANEKKKAEATSQIKSNFLSTMSHEIRTPMNAIIGMTTIAHATDDPAKKDYALDRIEEASEHLLGIINDILDMSKIEADKFELSLIEFRFERMLQKVSTVIEPRIESKNQILTITLDKNVPPVLISDDQRLTQVIINLLSNAVKFTDEKGAIGLDVTLLGERDGVYEIQVMISDTGIGLGEDQIDRLFGSFEQAESGTARKYGGTGLGLSISKSIVELLGGRIWVESTLGEGSRFYFTFTAPAGLGARKEIPIDTTAGSVSLQADATAEVLLKGKRVLLVEDNEVNCEIVVALLEPSGVIVDSAFDGFEALEKFAASPRDYDLILMDIMMPEMDGYEATGAIRALADPHAQRIPIVAMTANVFQEDIDKALAAGMNDHIGKPVDYDRLLATLREHLR